MNCEKLIFEKVSDIDCHYPYLCVYDNNDNLIPFMEISITDEKKIEFIIYQNNRNISLNFYEWQIIQENAIYFLQQELKNED